MFRKKIAKILRARDIASGSVHGDGFVSAGGEVSLKGVCEHAATAGDEDGVVWLHGWFVCVDRVMVYHFHA